MEFTQRAKTVEKLSSGEIHGYGLSKNIECISANELAVSLFLIDLVILLVAGVTPVLLYEQLGTGLLGPYLSVVCGSMVLFIIISRERFRAPVAYEAEMTLDWRKTVPRSILSFLLTFFGVAILGIATKTTHEYSRVWFFSWLAVTLVSSISIRIMTLASAESKLARGACLQRALIVTHREDSFTASQLALATNNRIRAVGTVILEESTSAADLLVQIRKLKPHLVILSLPWSQVEAAIVRFSTLSHQALDVLILPDASTCLQKAIRIRRFGHQALLQIVEPPLAAWDRVIKRIEDVVVASVALVLTSPLMLLTAIAIKLESKGPVLFKQTRVGLNGDHIEVWKFRSMLLDGTDPDAVRQTSKGDPRVTRTGRFIRRTSIDELPQFWNVLQGQMSVVGPRPHALRTFAEGKALDVIVEHYLARHRVKPGITGWAQINGARGELRSCGQVKQRVDYDQYYIEHWSVFFDIKIILITAMRTIYDPHAY